MKILVVQDWLRSGGTERQSVFLANAFADRGHSSTLLTFRPGGRLADTVAPAVQRCCLQPFDLHLDWLAPRLTGAAARLQPDIVLCMGRMANCYAGALQRDNGRTVVATMRTGKPLPWLFRRSLRHVRHVVANSHEARNTLAGRYGVPSDRITVIYNSIVFAPEGRLDDAGAELRSSVRARHGAGPDTTVLLCVAMFRPEKNQQELVEIVSGLPLEADVQLWLAGEGPARSACERLVEAKRLGNRVKFVGFHRDPVPLYAAADMAVHASWSESLSNFLIEAQAHGLPVVAYEAQGNRECFVPAWTGWTVPQGDRRAFRERLIASLHEPQQVRFARSAQARSYARTTFEPQRQVDAYLELFSSLLRP